MNWPRPDRWLDRRLPLIVERAAGSVVFELGCGTGDDTVTLVSSDLNFIALDVSRQAIAVARARASAARFIRQDVRAPFLVEPGSGHPEIEENYFSVNGEPKRFFDKVAVDRLFAEGWTVLGVEKTVSAKYLRPKVLWEVVLEEDAW